MLTIEQIESLKVGDTVYFKHGKNYQRSKGILCTVSKIGRKYIEFDDTSHKIVIKTGEVTKDYRGYSPMPYLSEEEYDEYESKLKFIENVLKACKDLSFEQAKLVNDTLKLDVKL